MRYGKFGGSRTMMLVAALLAAGIVAPRAFAEEGSPEPSQGKSLAKKLKPGEFNPDDASVEMFAAMEQGQLEVKFIAQNAKKGLVIIKNNTDKPLNVKLPEVFAGVPVLAQFGGAGGGGGGGGNRNGGGMGGGGNQSMGGGMGGMGGGGMGMGGMGGGMGGGGGGFFNVAPEKEAKFRVPLLCLDHGKKDPRVTIPYKIVPFDSFSSQTEVRELLRAFGYGKLNQQAAQAAAWHFRSGLSWQYLASKSVEHLNGEVSPYFSQEQLGLAIRYAYYSIQRAKAPKEETPTKAPSAATSASAQ